MGFARLVLGLSALVFAGTGLVFLVRPDTAAAIVSIGLGDALARNDLRAVYGGLQLGIAVGLAWSACASSTLRPGLVALLLLFGGLVFGRAVSMALEGMPPAPGPRLLAAELLGLALAALALARLRGGRA